MEKFDSLNAETRLAAYRHLLDCAHAMLQAAREERWDDLTALDEDRLRAYSSLVNDGTNGGSPSEDRACAELIKKILECDEQTSALVIAWQSEMAEVLGTMDNSRKLANAYRSG